MSAINAVFVIGHSPAVLTETLAGAVHREPGLRFAEISVISTRSGADLLRHRLFDEGGWEAFLDEWPEFSGTLFSAHNIMALECGDIRSEQDNRKLVETVLQLVCRLTAECEPPLLASLAGGRKTMGYYMGFAMSLFGRPGDRLTHVLVPGEWERDPDFLVPRRAEADCIDLVDIPFNRLRDLLPGEIRRSSVEQLVEFAQTSIDVAARPQLIIDYDSREIEFLGRTLVLPVREFVFFRFFLRQKLRHCRHPGRASCGDCVDCYMDWNDLAREENVEDLFEIRRQYRRGESDPDFVEFKQSWRTFEDFRTRFPELKSRLNGKLKRGFGFDPRVEGILLGKVQTGSGYARFGLAVDKSQVLVRS